MASTADSEAYFDQRMATLGVPMPVQTDMRARGWTSMGSFAFSSPFQPGQSDEGPFVQGVLVPLLGVNWGVDVATPRVRRLYFEAHTISVQDLRRRVESREDDQPVKLPIEERAARLHRLRDRFPGTVISGQSEPSHRLVDLLVQQMETGQVKYVHWSQCTSKLQEVHGVKQDSSRHVSYVTGKSGSLDPVPMDVDERADITSDLLLQQAMTRRSYAYELAGLCESVQMEALTAKLMREYMRPPMEQYLKVTIQQVERADRFIFSNIAERAMTGLQPVGGVRPFQTALVAAMAEPEFAFLLMQMPRGSSSSGQLKPVAVVVTPTVVPAPPTATFVTPDAKGKGKGKKLKVKKTVFKTKDNKNICFKYQRGKCDLAKDGEACPKGLHVCWLMGCEKPHPANKHV